MVEASTGPHWHTGPWYGPNVPQGCKMDPNSNTSDTGRGGSKIWFHDSFGHAHHIDFSHAPESTQVAMAIPIPRGGSFYWQDQNARFPGSGLFGKKDPYQERTGFNQNVSWITVQFNKMGDTIRFHSTGYFSEGEGNVAGLITEIKARFGDVKDISADVQKIVESGAKVAEDVAKIYAAGKGVPVPPAK